MNGRFLMDTNIVIAIFANDATVINSLANANEVFVPSTALGELYCRLSIIISSCSLCSSW